MNRRSTPPPANTFVILAADLVSTRAAQLLDAAAWGGFEPAQKLREALQVYAECRLGSAVKDASAGATITDCTQCRLVGSCITPGEIGCSEYEPITMRSGELVPLHSALRHLSVDFNDSADRGAR